MATIYDLPDEILEYILSLVLPYEDLHSCMVVSKDWRKHVKNVVRRRKRKLIKSIINFDVNWSTYEPLEGCRCIGRRYSHSAVFCDNAMYIFGGCTCSMTTYNDLWKYDLSRRKWIRPLATGTYPSPKACSSFVNYKNTLILFGGWTYPPSYPLYQSCHLFNELHVYDIQNNHWRVVETSVTPPPMAGHSTSIIHDTMIVFAGLIKHEDSVEGEKSNDVWKLNLTDWTWAKQEIEGTKKPECRFGQTQVILDDENLLILGGSGGSHIDYSDAWILNMPKGRGWRWIPVEIRGRANKPKNIWSNPGCKVEDKMVVLNRLQTEEIFPLNSNRNHSQFAKDPSVASTSKQPDLDKNVNGIWGKFRYTEGEEQQIMRISEIHERTSGVFPNKRKYGIGPDLRSNYNQKEMEVKQKQRPKHCLGLYVLDLEHAKDDRPYVTWLKPKQFNKGPKETILYTLVEGNSELIMFGGIESDGTTVGPLNSPITNSIHIMSCNIDVI